MTMRELAAEAGVSVSTVSKAFNNSAEIGEATRQQIFELAKKHGCFHKYYKEKYANKVIAVLCPEIKSAHYSEQVEYIQQRLAKNHIEVLISTDDFNAEKQLRTIELLTAHTKVDGMIVFDLCNSIPKGIETPIVAIGIREGVNHTDAIRGNAQKTMAAAVAHLKELGHRHIAFIGEGHTATTQLLFEQAMQQYGLESDLTVLADGRFEEAGKDGIRRLLASGRPFTAAICAYDYMAIGAIKELKKQGLGVPEDVSIIGNNNIRTAGHLENALTTIDQAKEAICDLACDLLVKKMQNKYYCAGTAIRVTGSLIVRETTGPCKNNF